MRTSGFDVSGGHATEWSTIKTEEDMIDSEVRRRGGVVTGNGDVSPSFLAIFADEKRICLEDSYALVQGRNTVTDA